MGEDDKETDLSKRPSNGRAQQIQTTEFVYNLHAGLFFSVQSGIKKSRLDTQKKKKKKKRETKETRTFLRMERERETERRYSSLTISSIGPLKKSLPKVRDWAKEKRRPLLSNNNYRPLICCFVVVPSRDVDFPEREKKVYSQV